MGQDPGQDQCDKPHGVCGAAGPGAMDTCSTEPLSIQEIQPLTVREPSEGLLQRYVLCCFCAAREKPPAQVRRQQGDQLQARRCSAGTSSPRRRSACASSQESLLTDPPSPLAN